jgi:hypothetical protein
MVFKEISTVYSENHAKHTDAMGKMEKFEMLKKMVHTINTVL